MTKPRITVRFGEVSNDILTAQVGDKVMATRVNGNGEIEDIESTVIDSTDRVYSADELLFLLKKGKEEKRYDKLSPLAQKVTFEIIKAGIVTTMYDVNLGEDGYSIPYHILGSDYKHLTTVIDELESLSLVNRNKDLTNDPDNKHCKIIVFNVWDILGGDYLNPFNLKDYAEFMDFYNRAMKDDTESTKLRIDLLLELERGGFYNEINQIENLEYHVREIHQNTNLSKTNRLNEILEGYNSISKIIKNLPEQYHKYQTLYDFKAIRHRHRPLNGCGDDLFSVINRNDTCLCGSGKKYKKCCL